MTKEIQTAEGLVQVHDRFFKKYISTEEIAAAIDEMAEKINRDFEGKPLIFLVVLKGSMIFASDLVRKITLPCRMETVRARSYGNRMTTSGRVELEFVPEELEGKNIIIVEDIVDSGLTLKALIERLLKEAPASVNIAALLSKPEARKTEIEIQYCGIEIPPVFVVGYGLDYAEYGRNLPQIYALADE
ncbi:MAG: hypoxanthine phosphoribosyltransferase [Bacteroidota bacterium]